MLTRDPAASITIPEGTAYANNQGALWHTQFRDCCTPVQVDPETGADLGEGDLPISTKDSDTIAWEHSTYMSTRINNQDYTPNTPELFFTDPAGVPGSELSCAVKPERRTFDEHMYALVDGEGHYYEVSTPVVGYLHVHGTTLLVTTDGQLLRSHSTELTMVTDVTYDWWGKRYYFHQLPWNAWCNVQVRSAAASAWLRACTDDQAAQLLDSVVSIACANAYQLDLQSGLIRMVSDLLELPVTDDLCASVAQCVLHVRQQWELKAPMREQCVS